MINEIIGRLGKENLERIAVENHVAIKNAVYVLLDVGMQYKIMTAEEFSKNQEYKEIDYFSQIINTNKSVDNKKWQAYIMFKKKMYHLGMYDKKEDVAKARKEAEDKYFNAFLDEYNKNMNNID